MSRWYWDRGLEMAFLIWDYYESIKAAHKEFIWFDNSGHFPFLEERQKFANELVRRVLPLANSRSGDD